MCDLWRNTLTTSSTADQILQQIDSALALLPMSSWLKLYNSGSFFDRAAIPCAARQAIASKAQIFHRLVVENHPRLTTPGLIFPFRDSLNPQTDFEVAMGLESANPYILQKLNKGFNLSHFEAACGTLKRAGIFIRAFVLIHPPFTTSDMSALEDMRSTARFAQSCGVDTLSLIPTRGTEQFVRRLRHEGLFTPPSLPMILSAASAAREYFHGRILVDTWDLPSFISCRLCAADCMSAITRFNRFQTLPVLEQCQCSERKEANE